MNKKKLRKVGLLLVLFGSTLGVSLQSYANDSVIFYIGVNGSMIVDTSFSLTTNDEELVQSGTKLMFQHTNIYKEGEMIDYSNRQQQSGTFNVMQEVKRGAYLSVRCIGIWEHDFWIDKKGKHDRFYVMITNGNQYCRADDSMTKLSGVHKSGHTSWVKTYYSSVYP